MQGKGGSFGSVLVLGAVSLLLVGCATPYKPKPTVTRLTDNHVTTETASMSSTYLIKRHSPYIFCSQPEPDAGYSESGDFSVNVLSIGDHRPGDVAKQQSGELEMQGRTPSVLLARELLYRLCEFARNQDLSTDQAIQLYKDNLKLIKAVSIIEARHTKVTVKTSDVAATAIGAAQSGAKPSESTPNENSEDTSGDNSGDTSDDDYGDSSNGD